MSKCIECGAPLLNDARFCSECGTKVVRNTNSIVCPSCGEVNIDKSTFCSNCGSELKPKTKKKTRSRTKKTSTKATAPKTSKLGRKAIKTKRGSGRWITVILVLSLAAGAWYWWSGGETPDYSPYVVDNTEKENTSRIDEKMSPTNPALEQARKEYLEAFEKYTELVTTGGKGDVQSALQDYKEKYQRFKQLEAGNVEFPDNSQTDPTEHHGTETMVDGSFSKEKNLGRKTVDNRKSEFEIPGEISVKIAEGTFETGTKELTIYRATSQLLKGRFFELDLENAPPIFNKPVEIKIPLQKGDDPNDFVAIDEIAENIWMVVPSEYDEGSHSIKFKTQHFSIKGIVNYVKAKISGLGSRDVRDGIGQATGMVITAGTLVVILGSVPVTLKIGATIYLGGILLNTTGIARTISDPLADEVSKIVNTDLNTSLKLSDELTVTWVDDPKSKSHLAGERISVCKNKTTGKIEFVFYENVSGEHQELVKKIINNSPIHEIVRLPLSILNLVAEVKMVKNYYKEKGYEVPPHTEIWIYDHKDAGAWNGSKLEIDVNYIAGNSDEIAAARFLTLSHEYWHSVFDYNDYRPEYKWLDECFATSFEGQISPSADLWYTKGLLPTSEQFYISYPADKVARSLGTGFIYYGDGGNDADLIKRGYNLWPWGKYLLANQGHAEIQQLLKGNLSEKLFSGYFKSFTKAILFSDYAIDAKIEENIDFEGVPVSYETPSGWHVLNPENLFGSTSLQLGNAKEYQHKGYLITPVPQSLYIGGFYPKPPQERAPLIVRRILPDEREEYIIFPSSAKRDKFGRYSYNDVFNDVGSVVLSPEQTKGKEIASMFGVINATVEHSYDEYFGYEENPIIAYYLRKPRRVELNERTGKMELKWTAPELDKGLKEKDFLKGYHIYLKDKKRETFLKFVGTTENKIDLMHVQLSGYSEIGVATVDKEMKGPNGEPLISEIHWIPIKSLGGKWVKVKENYSYWFDDKQGTETTATHSNYQGGYSYKIGAGYAETSNSNNGRNTVGIHTARFTHTWSTPPEILVPGKQISQKISVKNNGSSGKNALTLYGETKLTIYDAEVDQSVSAGGALYKDLPWEEDSEASFNWTVPKPDYMTLSNPSKYPMKFIIEVSSRSDGSAKGYCTIEYEYRN